MKKHNIRETNSPYYNKRAVRIVDMLARGKKAREIRDILGTSFSFIRAVAVSAGLHKPRSQAKYEKLVQSKRKGG
jgi:hypothetical protein